MPANSIQLTAALDREASFGAGIANWDSLSANGGLLNLFDVNTEGVAQEMLENRNLRQRASAARAKLLSLKNGAFSFASYLYGGAANAAAGAQAARVLIDEIYINALAGETRGYAAGLTGAGTTAAPVIDEGDLDSQDTYSWGLFYDNSAAAGYFRKFSTITDGGGGSDDTVNLLTGHVLPFAPAAADNMHAVMVHYPYWVAMEDHAHAGHYTHSMFFKGRNGEDSVEPQGVKFGLGGINIEAGTRASIEVTGMGATFRDPEGITQPTLAGTPSGTPGKTIGSGTATLMEIADVGSDLAAQNFWGAASIGLGVEYEAVAGPNGLEGKHGHGLTSGSYESTTLEVTVPFDDDWMTAFRAETRKHMLIQVGTTPTNTYGIYFPNLAMSAEPKPTDVNGRKALTLTFDCLEDDQIDVSSLSEAATARAKAKFAIIETR